MAELSKMKKYGSRWFFVKRKGIEGVRATSVVGYHHGGMVRVEERVKGRDEMRKMWSSSSRWAPGNGGPSMAADRP